MNKRTLHFGPVLLALLIGILLLGRRASEPDGRAGGDRRTGGSATVSETAPPPQDPGAPPPAEHFRTKDGKLKRKAGPNPLASHRPGISAVGAAGPADYALRDKNVTAFFGRGGITLALMGNATPGATKAERRAWGLHWGIVGGAEVEPRPEGERSERVNSFVGDRSRWKTDQRSYDRVVYDEVKPGVDMVVESRKHGVKYTLHAERAADLAEVPLRYEGAASLRTVDEGAALEIVTDAGTLREDGLHVYQDGPSGRREVSARYRVTGPEEYAITLGAFDPELPLVVDPVIGWSSFVGGSVSTAFADDYGFAIAVDNNGNTYVGGYTYAADFPSTGGYDTQLDGTVDGFVTKVDSSGNLVWSTFLGGISSDYVLGVATNATGDAYVTGYTFSSNYPTTLGAYDTTYNSVETFITVIDSGGASLVWSTFLGGTSSDYGYTITVDDVGDVYVGGYTYSSNFPTTGGFDVSVSSTPDGFVSKLMADGTDLVWSSYLGGNGSDYVRDLAVGPVDKDVYVTGYTYSTDFPTLNAFDATPGVMPDAFVTRIDAPGDQLRFSTYLGGSSTDVGEAIALDATDDPVVTGYTSSIDFTITGGAWDTTLGGTDCFVTKLDDDGPLVWSTFLGGSSSDYGTGIALNAADEVIVGGYTLSTNFPTTPGAFDTTRLGYEGFVTHLDNSGDSLHWSGFVGGSNSEYVRDLAIDSSGNAYITGYTYSTDYPLQNEFDSALGGGIDSFVSKVNISGNALDFSSYLGGESGPGDDFGYDLAVDSAGNAYIIGRTNSSDFPTTVGSLDPVQVGNEDIFITCLDPTGAVGWSTYMGGTGDDYPQALTVDADGDLYATGYTYSFDYPTTLGAFQESVTVTAAVFVSKLASTGDSLLWSSYLGGDSGDYAFDIAVDSSENVYVTGYTYSSLFPLQNPFDALISSTPDAFATKFNAGGATLGWSTYLGGTGIDYAYAITADAGGTAYVTGRTSSIDYPTTVGAYDTTLSGTDAFVTVINPAGMTLAWSTFLGGTSTDEGFGIKVDAAGDVYVGGDTFSFNFPTTGGAFSETSSGSYDVFVTKLDSGGAALLWSTYIGGSSSDYTEDLDIDAAGNAYVTGYTYSPDFPMKGAFSPLFGGGTDAFVTKVDSSGSGLSWSSYLGGTDTDYAFGIERDGAGNVHVAGYTYSDDFPTDNGFDTTLGGDVDAFITRIDNDDPAPPTSLEQFRIDGSTPIGIGAWTNETDFVVEASIDDSDDDLVRLEVEVQPIGTAFTGSGVLGGLASAGSVVQVQVPLPAAVPAEYHWQARTVDDAGNTSAWVSFGGNSDSPLPADRDVGRDTTDPLVAITSPTAAATYHTPSSPVALAGSSSDSEAGVTSITWTNDQGGSGTAAGTTSWSIGAVALVQGVVNRITVTAIDAAGNTQDAILDVTYDIQAPMVMINSPTPLDTYVTGMGSLGIGGTASDDFVVDEVTWSNDRGGGGTATGTTAWTATVTLSPGTNIITVRAADEAGNTGTDTITVTYDTVNPTVMITTPAPPTFITAGTTVDISGTAADNEGVAMVEWFNSATMTGAVAGGTTSWSATMIPVNVGANPITITATDVVGNTASTMITVHRDNAVPMIMITLPTDQDTYTTGSTSIALGGTSSDDVEVDTITWSNVEAMTNGSATLSGPANAPTWSIPTINLVNGQNTITVTVNDKVGNPNSDTITVTFDDTSPSVVFNTPGVATIVTNMTPFAVDGVATDQAPGTIVDPITCENKATMLFFPVNPSPVVPATSVPWSSSVDLVAGSNIIEVIAEDDAGNTTPASVEIIYDPTAPTVTITGPTTADTFVTNTGTVSLAGISGDNRGVLSVDWDNTTRMESGMAVGTTTWSVASIDLNVGPNVIVITATDEAGNTGTDTITVTYDLVLPDISITGPSAASQVFTTSASADLTGTSSDDVSVDRVVWSNAATGDSGTAGGTTSWSAPGVGLLAGTNVLTTVAFDEAGNTRTDTIVVYYDTADPTVAITTPTSSPTYSTNAGVIALAGTASDDIAVATVTWDNPAASASGTAVGTTSWSIPSITLSPGINVITVTASDFLPVPRTDTAVLTVTYDPTAPLVEIQSPTNLTTYSTTTTPIALGGIASDNEGLTQVSWLNTTTGGNGPATGLANWTAAVPLTSGDNVINIIAYDAGGNSSTDTITVTYDPAAPIVQITSPTTAITFTTGTTPITLGGTASDDVGVTSVDWTSDQAVVPASGTANGTTTWSASIPLAAGSNVISVTASDNVGRTGTTRITIIYDPEAPEVTITNPTTDTTFDTTLDTLTMEGTANDNLTIQSVDWSNDSTGASGTANGTGTWIVSDIPLVEGQNVITITATDGVGNTGTSTLTVTYDATAPTVAITSPTPPTFATTTRPITVDGTASDNLEVTTVLWVNSLGGSGTATLTGPVTAPSWSASIYLFPGDNIITVTALDGLSNQSTAMLTVTFTAETTLPNIVINTPTGTGTATSSTTPVTVGGTADDNVGVVSVTWENLTTRVKGIATLSGGPNPVNWSDDIPLTDGVNDIVATAVDDAGNTASAMITITFSSSVPDAASPMLGFTLPTSSGVWSTSTSPLPVTLTATDDVGVSSVEWFNAATGGDGVASPVLGTNDWTSAVALAIGVNVITATAYDPFGNTATDTLTVTFSPLPGDATSPTIAITSPPTGATTVVSSSVVTVTGTATDNVALAAIIWLNAATGGSGTADGLSLWSGQVPLTPGLNVLTLTSFDTSGNKTSDTVVVDYRPPPPPPEYVPAGHCGLLGVDLLGLAGLLWLGRRLGRRARRTPAV